MNKITTKVKQKSNLALTLCQKFMNQANETFEHF